MLILKSLAISKLIHTLTILHTPQDIITDIEKIIFDFLWDSHDRIKRKTLIGKKEVGGIDMLDIISKNKALKASWMRFMHSNNVNSKIVNMYLQKLGIDTIYLAKSSIKNPKILKELTKLPMFWCEVFAFFNECKSIKPDTLLNDNDFLLENRHPPDNRYGYS